MTSPTDRPIPLYAYILLPAAVLAVSSAASVFGLMPDVPPLTLAAWRLQLTAAVLAVGAVVQWRRMNVTALQEAGDRQRTFSSAHLLVASGLCLALHFGTWVWGLQHTSLTHSLLMVSCTPLLIASWAWATGRPVTRMELLGMALGIAGGGLLAASGAAEASGSVPAHQQRQPHVSGDLASLAAAAAIVGYLEIGRRLRRWMPLFVYACPVTGAAALMLTLAALATESAAADSAGVRGGVLLGWVLKWEYAACVVYLALGPGIVGHTGFNALLRWLTPLSVALAFQLEPLVGSLIGWAMGLVPRPGWGTWVGGGALLVATGVVTAASARRGQGEDERQDRGREVELEGLMAEGRVEGGTSMDATASYTYTLEGGEKGILDREGD